MTIHDKIETCIPKNVAFYMGDWKEIARNFAVKKDNSTRFPAIILSPQFVEKERNNIYNSFDFTLFICYPTNKNYSFIQREELIFDQCIMPIWEELKVNFVNSKYICTSYDGSKFDSDLTRVPWEMVDGTKLNDIVDVLQVEIKDFKMWLRYYTFNDR